MKIFLKAIQTRHGLWVIQHAHGPGSSDIIPIIAKNLIWTLFFTIFTQLNYKQKATINTLLKDQHTIQVNASHKLEYLHL